MGKNLLQKSGFDRLLGRLRLAKVWLCLLIGTSTLFGYLMVRGAITVEGVLISLGIFLLSMGGATVNSCQERAVDKKMERTRNRPMARGEFSLFQAGMQGGLLLAGGLIAIYFGSASILAVFLAGSGIALYNLVYTPLKKQSLFAIFPGAVCGAIPPCVGWIGGGGDVADYRFWLLFVLFFLWQIPHFWLVMLMHRQDYRRGVFPSLLDRFPDGVVKGFFVPWVGSLLTIMLLFAILPDQGLAGARWWIVINCLVLGTLFLFQFSSRQQPAYRLLFVTLNISLVVHMGAVSVGLLMA